jgi:hypothetical protein
MDAKPREILRWGIPSSVARAVPRNFRRAFSRRRSSPHKGCQCRKPQHIAGRSDRQW